MKATVIKGILAGIIFVSAGYGTTVLSWVTDSFYLIPAAAFAVNIAVGFLLAGKTYLEMFTAWGLSITSGLVTFLIYTYSGFLNKCLNIIFPEYGEMSAGGGLGIIVIFGHLFFYYFFAVIMAVGVTAIKKAYVKNSNKNIGL